MFKRTQFLTTYNSIYLESSKKYLTIQFIDVYSSSEVKIQIQLMLWIWWIHLSTILVNYKAICRNEYKQGF